MWTSSLGPIGWNADATLIGVLSVVGLYLWFVFGIACACGTRNVQLMDLRASTELAPARDASTTRADSAALSYLALARTNSGSSDTAAGAG